MPELFSVLDGWQSAVLLSFFPVVSLAPLQDAGRTSTATDNSSEKSGPLCFHFMCASLTAAWLGLYVFLPQWALGERDAHTNTHKYAHADSRTQRHKHVDCTCSEGFVRLLCSSCALLKTEFRKLFKAGWILIGCWEFIFHCDVNYSFIFRMFFNYIIVVSFGPWWAFTVRLSTSSRHIYDIRNKFSNAWPLSDDPRLRVQDHPQKGSGRSLGALVMCSGEALRESVLTCVCVMFSGFSVVESLRGFLSHLLFGESLEKQLYGPLRNGEMGH